jgi:hypothetical protein
MPGHRSQIFPLDVGNMEVQMMGRGKNTVFQRIPRSNHTVNLFQQFGSGTKPLPPNPFPRELEVELVSGIVPPGGIAQQPDLVGAGFLKGAEGISQNAGS